jgi:hypothetical protein
MPRSEEDQARYSGRCVACRALGVHFELGLHASDNIMPPELTCLDAAKAQGCLFVDPQEQYYPPPPNNRTRSNSNTAPRYTEQGQVTN